MEEIDEGDYLSDCDEEDYYKNENKYIYRETNIIKKFNVTFYFKFNQKKKYVIPISTENLNVNDLYIYDLIRYIIKKINNSNINIKDSEANYSVSLKDIDEDNKDFYVNNYEFKPYNFWSTKDCKKYFSTDLLNSIDEENISLVSKNPLNILLMKQF